MTKSALAIAAAIITLATMSASSAEAGFKVRLGFGGPVPFQGHNYSNDYQPKTYKKKAYRKIERRAVRKDYAAKTPAVTKAEPVETAAAEMENSSIATANDDVAQTSKAPTPKKLVKTAAVEEVEELGCKQFVPAVGMTVSVPCE